MLPSTTASHEANATITIPLMKDCRVVYNDEDGKDVEYWLMNFWLCDSWVVGFFVFCGQEMKSYTIDPVVDIGEGVMKIEPSAELRMGPDRSIILEYPAQAETSLRDIRIK